MRRVSQRRRAASPVPVFAVLPLNCYRIQLFAFIALVRYGALTSADQSSRGATSALATGPFGFYLIVSPRSGV
jgi:hypothetical protein